MDSTPGAIHIYLNPIASDKADAWQSFVRSAIMPVFTRQREDLAGHVRLLRSDHTEDGITTFAFVFDGGDIADYDVETVFAAEYGDEEGERMLAPWHSMYAADQYGWTFQEIPLENPAADDGS
jgi:hypothetical protein